jgi:hypothetical protein
VDIFWVNNDTLNSMDQLERSVVAILQGLHGLPQPRSRIAFAAKTRAAAVASFERMTPTAH